MSDNIKQKYTAFHIANYFLWRSWKEGIEITPLKLIKLVYITYGWNLVLNETRKKLFEERIEAWKHGPVLPSIYHEFKKFGNRPIEKNNYATGESGQIPMIDRNDTEVLTIASAIWKKYQNKTGPELTSITHEANGAWYKAYYNAGVNSALEDDDIKKRAEEAIDAYNKEYKTS